LISLDPWNPETLRLEGTVNQRINQVWAAPGQSAREGLSDLLGFLHPFSRNTQGPRQAHEINGGPFEVHTDVPVALGGDTLQSVRPLFQDAVAAIVANHEYDRQAIMGGRP
jgi:hypothetical protein